MRAKVELFEHETVRIGDALRVKDGAPRAFGPAEHDALARYDDLHGGRFFRLGHRSVTTTQYVGYVEVGDLAIEILPKADRVPTRGTEAAVWREGLLDMLRVATGLRLESPSPASQSSGRSTLLELLVLRFVGEIERLLREGLAKGYRDVESNGTAFRGRLLFAEHLRENLVHAERSYVRYAAFDHDVLVNRTLREALDTLRDLALTGSLSARVRASAAAFPEVSRSRTTGEMFDNLVLGRSTARYRDALVLARMILERRAPQLRAGGLPVFALLFDMNVLWESYVGGLFRRAAGSRYRVTTQESAPFWRASAHVNRGVRPDVLIRRADKTEVLLVADTKWKVAPDGVPGDADLKQMFVYNELFKAPRAVLLYPSTGAAVGRTGAYAGCSHRCETMQLGVIAGMEWRRNAMIEQVATLLGSLEAKAGGLA